MRRRSGERPHPGCDGNAQINRFAISLHSQIGRVTHRRIAHLTLQGGSILDRFALEFDYQVILFKSRRICRAVRDDIGDQGTFAVLVFHGFDLLGRQITDAHTQPAADHLAMVDQGLGHMDGHIARNSKTDPLKTARLGRNGRINTNDLPRQIDQRPATVAWIDGRIGLQIILV